MVVFSLNYRRELDGLRALAVIAVIFYHANVNLAGIQIFKGGYFGVDIFFVLSGYLITSIIRKQMDNGGFSFTDFYWRRFKRIVPALFFMLIVSSILAYYFLLPNELLSYAKSLKSTLYFGSNYHFLNEDSYTAESSIFKPLLHTWSLAVEWQFYIVYPVIVWFIYRFFKNYTFSILLALGLLSLQFSQVSAEYYPDIAFYLLPSRAWELIFGGLITFFNRELLFKSNSTNLNYLMKAMPLIGMYMVMYSMFFIDNTVPHPSFITLIPIIGTIIVILFSKEGELVNDILSLKPIVFIGVISYSLYLWHQPFFVFFRLLKHNHIRYEQFAGLCLLIIIMTLISYKFIEAPFRRTVTKRKSVFVVLIMFVSCALFSNYVVNKNGLPERMDTAANEASNKNPYKCMLAASAPYDSGPCVIGNKNNIAAIIVGDSHADAITTAISSLLDLENYGMIAFTRASCPFIFNMKLKTIDVNNCSQSNELILKTITDKYPNIPIVVTSRTAAYIYGQTNPERITNGDQTPAAYFTKKYDLVTSDLLQEFSSAFTSAICKISQKNPIFITEPIPEMRVNVPKAMTNRYNFLFGTLGVVNSDNLVKINKEDYFERNNVFIDLMKNTSKSCNVDILKVSDYLCDEHFCYGASEEGRPYYYDGDHLSEFGNKLLSPMFKSKLNLP